MKLVSAPAEILKIPTIDVDEDMDNIVQYAKQMHETMIQNNGIGLAAPQVGINKSFFIMGDIQLNIRYSNSMHTSGN